MATIKLQEGRVLTRVRDGRTFVQCECCTQIPPEECCMYPADKLNILYREEDVPLEIWMGSYDLWPEATTVLLERSGLLWGPHSVQATDGTHQFRFNQNQWQRETPAGFIFDANNCLFSGRSDEDDIDASEYVPGYQWGAGPGNVFDNFQDTYSVTQTQPARIFTVTRESLCVWRSRNENGDVDNVLYYDTTANEQNVANSGIGRVLWRFNGSYRSDAGPYNSPAGVYGNMWTVV